LLVLLVVLALPPAVLALPDQVVETLDDVALHLARALTHVLLVEALFGGAHVFADAVQHFLLVDFRLLRQRVRVVAHFRLVGNARRLPGVFLVLTVLFLGRRPFLLGRIIAAGLGFFLQARRRIVSQDETRDDEPHDYERGNAMDHGLPPSPSSGSWASSSSRSATSFCSLRMACNSALSLSVHF